MLGQGLRRGCGPLGRGLSTSATAAQAVPAIAGETSGGFLSKLFGGGAKGRITTPLSEPLEGVNLPLADPPLTQQPTTEVTTLGNGLKVASEATPGPTASLGLYINAGSVNETDRTGVSHLLETLAFKATQHRTHFRLVREVENIGASTVASASREQLVYIIDVSKAAVPEALEILTDAVLNPKFAAWDVREAAAKLEEDIKSLADNPQSLLLEGLHSVAYHGGLGRPLIAPPGAASRITPDDLAQFVQDHFTGSNMALAGAGIEHSELAQLAAPLLQDVPQGAPSQAPASKYVGGDFRTPQASAESHALLAFEVPGGWHDMKGSIATTVLQFLLGGGGSFSSGGPGKGMHSRLYTRVLNQHHWVHNASAFSSVYDHTGVAGIHITTESGKIEQGVDIACKELQSLTKDVPEVELTRAKRAALGTVLSSLEGRAVVAEDIGRQLLTYGARKPVAEFVSTLEGITAGDISKLATKMLSSPPSFAGCGNIASMPRYDTLLRRFS